MTTQARVDYALKEGMERKGMNIDKFVLDRIIAAAGDVVESVYEISDKWKDGKCQVIKIVTTEAKRVELVMALRELTVDRDIAARGKGPQAP